MNLPNQLTTARFILAIPFIYFLQTSDSHGFWYRMIALVYFFGSFFNSTFSMVILQESII